MVDRIETSSGAGGGFGVLDGVALVTGAAVASVHLRYAVPGPESLGEWVWFAGLFAWLAITSAGPFLYLVRKFGSRPPGYPRLGDRLWILSGLPWILAALLVSGERARTVTSSPLDPAYVVCLGVGLFLVAAVAVPVLTRVYLLGDPSQPRAPEPPTPWTCRLGLGLTVAWPLQCGAALVLLG